MSAVDVVITCHDQADLVLGAVDSVLAQTRAPRSVLIVDDGSTDPVTLEALETLQRRWRGAGAGGPAVSVIRQHNLHVSTARNTGIAAATSPYLSMLDADDRLEPGYLAATCAVLDEFPQVRAASSWLRSYGLGEWLIRPEGGDVTQFLARNNCPAELTFRRRDWVACGGYCEELTAGYEDWDFCLRLLTRGGRIHIVQAPLIRYRTHAQSLNMSGFPNRLELVGEILDRHSELFSRHLRELVIAKERIAVERLESLIQVFAGHPELDPGPVTYGDGGIAARVLIESARIDAARLHLPLTPRTARPPTTTHDTRKE